MKKGLIIASGEINNLEMLKEQIASHDYILCVDGGIRYIYDMDIRIDAIIGDLDSVDDRFSDFIARNNIPIFKFPVEKNETDTELAIEHLMEEKCDYITIMGAIGSRMDHTLANILLLKRLAKKNIYGQIIDDNNIIVLLNGYLEIKRKENYYLSIIPITPSGVLISLKGFYYKVEGGHIEYGSTLGISNKIVDEVGEITIKKGQALIIQARD